MKFLTFTGSDIEDGMSIEVMAKAMKDIAKKKPGATVDDLPGPICLNWIKSVGKGVVEIEAGGATTFINMPAKGAIFLPGDSVVRLRPEKGEGCTMTVSANGTYQAAQGANAQVPVSPLMPKEGDSEERIAALAWLREGRVGASSYTLCATLTGATDPKREDDKDNPWDADDFNRCDMFFKAVPSARAKIEQMISVSPEWAALAPVWSELEDLLAKQKAGGERLLSDRIRQLLDKPKSRFGVR